MKTFVQLVKVLIVTGFLAGGIWGYFTYVVGFEAQGCDQAHLPTYHVCLSTVMNDWSGKVLWIDARSQDDYERLTISQDYARRYNTPISVLPLRNDANAQELLAQAMPYLMQAGARGLKIVVFCDRSCTASDEVASELRQPTYGIDADVYVLEGGWAALKKDERFITD